MAASPAAAATVTSVAVVNSSSKIVSVGSTVAITGTGFTGMTDNASTGANSNSGACVATPAAGCSQVRFYGIKTDGSAFEAASGNFAVSTKYVVVSDTLIYAAVPALAASGAGAPTAGYGIIGVAVLNGTSLTAPAAFTSATTSPAGAGQLVYRAPLTADVAGSSTVASSTGGGTITVGVTGMTLASASFANERISATFSWIAANATANSTVGSPMVVATTVSYASASTVTVLVPPGTPSGELVAVELIHDTIRGTPDTGNLEYAAVINRIRTCPTFTIGGLSTALPTCTGPASGPTAAGSIYTEIAGKGLTGAGSTFDFDGADGNTASSCSVITDVLAYCIVTVTTAPTVPVAVVTFTPADPDGGGAAYTAPVVGVTPGSVFLYTDTV